jgi:hypothetical protein
MCTATQLKMGHGCQVTTVQYIRNTKFQLFAPQGLVPVSACSHCKTVDGKLPYTDYVARLLARSENAHLRELTAEEQRLVDERRENFRRNKEREARETAEQFRQKKLEAERSETPRTGAAIVPFPAAAVHAAGKSFSPSR